MSARQYAEAVEIVSRHHREAWLEWELVEVVASVGRKHGVVIDRATRQAIIADALAPAD